MPLKSAACIGIIGFSINTTNIRPTSIIVVDRQRFIVADNKPQSTAQWRSSEPLRSVMLILLIMYPFGTINSARLTLFLKVWRPAWTVWLAAHIAVTWRYCALRCTTRWTLNYAKTVYEMFTARSVVVVLRRSRCLISNGDYLEVFKTSKGSLLVHETVIGDIVDTYC